MNSYLPDRPLQLSGILNGVAKHRILAFGSCLQFRNLLNALFQKRLLLVVAVLLRPVGD